MIIDNLPMWLAVYIPAFSLLIAGHVVEKHYVSRISVFTNSMALTVFVLTHDASGVVTLYTDFGIVLGIIGLLAYSSESSLSNPYYIISGSLYGSIPVGTLLLSPQIEWVLAQAGVPDPVPMAMLLVLLMFLLNVVGLAMGDSSAVYRKARPPQVNDFIRNSKFRFPGERRWYRLNQWWDEE